jgi:hypothetical protein
VTLRPSSSRDIPGGFPDAGVAGHHQESAWGRAECAEEQRACGTRRHALPLSRVLAVAYERNPAEALLDLMEGASNRESELREARRLSLTVRRRALR